jgi:adenylate kinase
MTRRIAFLGLSGVGKSTLIGRLNKQTPLLHLQASALIKAEQAYRAQFPDSSESLRTGAVLDNQALMIAAFQRTTTDVEVPIVFDGHSVIDSRDGLVEIPASVFAELSLDAIFYLSAAPHIIAKRRLADTARKRPIRDSETLAEHQRIAIDAAQRIAEQIGCTFIQISDGDTDHIMTFLDYPPSGTTSMHDGDLVDKGTVF